MEPTTQPKPASAPAPTPAQPVRSAPVMDVRAPRSNESQPTVPPTPAPSHETLLADVLREPPAETGEPSAAVQQALKSQAAKPAAPAAPPKPAKAPSSGVSVIITITIVVMVVLSGLTVFAYLQSK